MSFVLHGGYVAWRLCYTAFMLDGVYVVCVAWRLCCKAVMSFVLHGGYVAWRLCYTAFMLDGVYVVCVAGRLCCDCKPEESIQRQSFPTPTCIQRPGNKTFIIHHLSISAQKTHKRT